ncbi:nuclear transport factor 2 family protein [Novosphingobium sp. FKTRR1]|uniref:nuclear transport factor 2 family protein n=1 Tax=unclassified Novosphingobium TaxID=2644732 RepID=UPI001CF04280|nr:nuclear transport factor 2 family protein [Novosphingobium sp. FKTRR1]
MTETIPPQATMKAALQAYVDRTNAGDAEGLVALFAPDAIIEDPVGSPVKHHGEFASWFADSVAFGAQITPVAPMRGSHGNAAALVLDVTFTPSGGQRLRIRSIDVCTFDAAGLITSLRAYWGPDDVEPVT